MIRRINLVPPSERPRTQTDFGLLMLLVACVVVVAGVVFSYVYLNGVLTDKQREADALSAQVANVQGQLAALAQYEELASKRQAVEEVVQHIYAGRTLVSQSLGDLSLVVPKEVWFQSLNLTAPPVPPLATKAGGRAEEAQGTGRLDIAGTTFSFDDVAVLLVRLQQVASLRDVKLGNAEVKSGQTKGPGAKLVQFQATAEVVNTQNPDTPLPVSPVQVGR